MERRIRCNLGIELAYIVECKAKKCAYNLQTGVFPGEPEAAGSSAEIAPL